MIRLARTVLKGAVMEMSALPRPKAPGFVTLRLAIAAVTTLSLQACTRTPPPAFTPAQPPEASQAHKLADLELGRWSEYLLGPPEMRVHEIVALVRRTADQADIETTTWIEADRPPPRLVTRDTYAIGSRIGDDTLATAAQIAANDPMELPASEQHDEPGLSLRNLTRRTLLNVEEIKAAGRSFSARRYRLTASGGQENDMWVSDEVQPIGVIRMAAVAPHATDDLGIELVRQGTGARPVITLKPGPFDRNAYRDQMMAPMGGALPPPEMAKR